MPQISLSAPTALLVNVVVIGQDEGMKLHAAALKCTTDRGHPRKSQAPKEDSGLNFSLKGSLAQSILS